MAETEEQKVIGKLCITPADMVCIKMCLLSELERVTEFLEKFNDNPEGSSALKAMAALNVGNQIHALIGKIDLMMEQINESDASVH